MWCVLFCCVVSTVIIYTSIRSYRSHHLILQPVYVVTYICTSSQCYVLCCNVRRHGIHDPQSLPLPLHNVSTVTITNAKNAYFTSFRKPLQTNFISRFSKKWKLHYIQTVLPFGILNKILWRLLSKQLRKYNLLLSKINVWLLLLW